MSISRTYAVLYLLLITIAAIGQEETEPKVEFKGYLKSLGSTYFLKLPIFPESQMFTDQLLHNRLNFKWYPSENITLYAELRNRLFWGDQVRLNPNYLDEVNRGSDNFFDWSVGKYDKKGYALHANLDRFYGEWTKGQWEVRLGRQRVNWGISTTWNPNDIFNAYNFTDFDYEERPGSDALRIRRYTGVTSSIEIAVKAANDWEKVTAAMLGKFHLGTYDLQVLAGVNENFIVAGGGWAGNLGNASFKGELSSFFPLADGDKTSVSLSMGIDYTLSNQMYLSGGFLYTSTGTTGNTNQSIFESDLSARQLFPYRWATLATVMYPITPLVNSAFIVLYSPGEANMLFLNPTLSASIAQNWDVDLVGQIVFQKQEKYESPVQAGFVRVKWSF